MDSPSEVREDEATCAQDNIVPDSQCQDNETHEVENSIPEDTNATKDNEDISEAENTPPNTSAEKNDHIPLAVDPIVDNIPSAPTNVSTETKAQKSIRKGKQPIWMKDYVTKTNPSHIAACILCQITCPMQAPLLNIKVISQDFPP
ncbi:hypothetical protein A4A49_35381 [Nicotiana attenuata]|uniref:Uncharacterized protein n=1 Tax=Nicotiana attenuata TaxID=49451 RepID=A0A314KIV3_NICAT|nr:hypothetical protein A4A49_35381 [Nicotiana attenuata]